MESSNPTTPSAIDAYIATFPPEVQARLKAVREAIRALAPGAEERISYGIPTFWQGRNLIHYAAFARHIGLYPGAAAIEVFDAELQAYRHARGSIQFPLQGPLPLALNYPDNSFDIVFSLSSVEHFGGQISVSSQPGQGTVFTLHLRSAESLSDMPPTPPPP